MKKLLQNLLIISAIGGLFSCSKKVTTFQFGKPYHDQSITKANETVIADEQQDIVTSSISEVPLVNEAQPVTTIKIERKANNPKIETPITVKPNFKERIAQKVIQKKIEKLQKGQAVNNNMKIGIVIAAISLVVLIVVAAGLLGGLSNLFWLLGGLGLLTGLIIILLAALDVI